MPQCFALFSGGLDSALAVKTMLLAGVDVIALNFVSHFFGGPSEKIEQMAKQLNVPVLFVPFQSLQLAVTATPKAGRGKNFNACIDCHATMLNIAGKMMSNYGVDFIVTGEVLGQRPMSQNSQALQQVAKMSGFANFILRPLSAQLLPVPDFLEKFNLKIDQFLSIQGRSSGPQEKLMRQYKLGHPSHGGGCMLTEPIFGNKMKQLYADQVICKENQFIYQCMRKGRLLRWAEAQYIIVGRNEQENMFLDGFRKYCEYVTAVTPMTEPQQLPGPTILILDFTKIKGKIIEAEEIQIKNDIEELQCGECKVCKSLENFQQQDIKFEANEDLKAFAKQAFNYFCKGKGKQDCVCEFNGELVEVKAIGEGAEKIIREKLLE
uniref:tRNA (5-methylaminomethyl-2-thiouridylate)-methyltransferase n=1 Tax=Trepomonas sp. PC1 TaxID=1076344 RepID=A0A146K1K8_9EUKA|eukprot:JAP90773.1 tRNA (5-methylaminomethyl-2-thiouridylate)-methyltransferase [Trepomonas sp. PC1]